MNLIYGVIFCFAGIFSLTSSVKDRDSFFNDRKARIFVKALGRNGARIFYGVLGLFFIAMGIFCFIAP